MLAKRIIPCLDTRDGTVVKGTRFVNLRSMGRPSELAARYEREGADEIVVLDISATPDEKATLFHMVEEVASTLSIPLCVGGGVRSSEDFHRCLLAGADKVGMNSAAVKRPDLVATCASEYGSQAVVVAVDVKKEGANYRVFISGGRTPTDRLLEPWIEEVTALGAGEILLTAIDRDGTKSGYDLELIRRAQGVTSLPIIASGGAGSYEDIAACLKETSATGALVASLFHEGTLSLPELKRNLRQEGVPVRL